MASLGGTLDETFAIDAPVDAVRERLFDLERHRRAVEEAERVDRLGDDTLRYVLTTQRHGPYSLTPDYTVRYRQVGDALVWETIEGNFDSSGRAEVRPTATGSEVVWRHTITFDLPIPGLVARGLKGVVQGLMVPGIRRYAQGVLQG